MLQTWYSTYVEGIRIYLALNWDNKCQKLVNVNKLSMFTSCQCLLAGFITTYQKMHTSGYAKAGTSRNTTYDVVSVNPTDERRAIHYTKDDISRMTFKTVTK